MANVKFTEFPSAATVGSTDIIPIVQGGTNKKATAAVFSTYIGSAFVALTGNQTIAGVKTFSSQLASSVATGTAPFSIASTTKVTNLNADLLDGYTSADFQLALTNPVTGTGTTNYLPKFTGTSALGNSLIYDNGTNVGIGITSPADKLDIYSSANSQQGLKITNPNAGTSAIAVTKYSNGTYTHLFGILGTNYTTYGVLQANEAFMYSAAQSMSFGADGDSSIKFGTGTGVTERMRITSAGNVGIGSTSPASLLEIAATSPTLRINSTTVGYDGILAWYVNTSYIGDIRANSGSGAMTFNQGPSAGWGGYMVFKTDTAERMRIFSDGNIAINSTTNAGYKLDVNGTARVSGQVLVNTGTSNQNTKIFGNKVGMSRTSDGAEVVYFSKNTDLGTEGTANINGYDGIQFRTQGAETVKAVITSVGQLAVGTTSPDASALMQIDSTTQGFLVPRMLESEINSISSPAAGLLVYNTDQNHMCMYDGSVWKKFSMSNM